MDQAEAQSALRCFFEQSIEVWPPQQETVEKHGMDAPGIADVRVLDPCRAARGRHASHRQSRIALHHRLPHLRPLAEVGIAKSSAPGLTCER
jgi:hypothetical protein